MNIDLSFFSYFLNAGIVVKLVLLLLIGASIVSWTFIFQRWSYLKKVKSATLAFEHQFWSGGDIAKMYSDTVRRKGSLKGLETLFHAGFKEYLRFVKQPGVNAEHVLENSKRAMHVEEMREQEELETHLPFLATVGSTSPYIGLFGTVWGIMLSLGALAHVQQATIAMVAPGLAEALIATAMGLLAAIPAVIAYNRFSNDINRLLNRFDAFQEEFANILFRQAQTQLNAPQHEAVEA